MRQGSISSVLTRGCCGGRCAAATRAGGAFTAALSVRRFCIRARSLALATSLLAGAGLTLAPVAGAGEYHVYSCRTPTGAPAPAGGWSGSISEPFSYDPDSCEQGGALTAALGANYPHVANEAFTKWTFSAPPGESIAAATLWRAGDAEGGYSPGQDSYLFWLAGPNDSYDSADVFEQCAYYAGCTGMVGTPSVPLSEANEVVVHPENLGANLYMNASCGGTTGASCPAGSGDPSGYAAVVYIYGANIVLEQDSQPEVSDVGGELASAATVSGTSDLTFAASDSGSGIYQALVEVDGDVVESPVLDENDGQCRNVGETTDGLPAFLYTQPCPQSLTADLPLDTTGLSDGQHHLVVRVTDAAGNSTVVLDRKIAVENHHATSGAEEAANQTGPTAGTQIGPALETQIGSGGPLAPGEAPNGANASDQAVLTAHWKGTGKTTLTGRYGASERVTGRLTTSSGQPIAGASIDAYETPACAGANAQALPSPRTGPAGEWSLTLPRDVSSSSLSFAYRSGLSGAASAATAALTLRVLAAVVLAITPHVTSVGHRIHFSGVVHGPIPPGGKQLVLEASSGGEWIQFDTVRTNAQGRYRASYRFRLPGPVTYRFRAISPYEADFPFLRGTSNGVVVHEL